MFAPTRGFSGMADSMEPCTMLWGRPLLPWQRNLGTKAHLWFNFFNFGALPNILHYITYNSASMADRPEMFAPTRGFWGSPIQWNHAKCCGADPCCHSNEIWVNLGYFSTKSPMSRLVCEIDLICLGLPRRRPAGPTFVVKATTFAVGAESNRLPACYYHY